jgi:hypothetical protein
VWSEKEVVTKAGRYCIEFVGKVGSERNINVREAVKNKTVPSSGDPTKPVSKLLLNRLIVTKVE